MASKSEELLKTFSGRAVTHEPSTSPASWREALKSAKGDVPEKFELLKTLVFKPRTAKTAVPIPVIVIAGEETETSSGALGKKLNLKELRLATEDLIHEFFGVTKDGSESWGYILMRCNTDK